LTPHEARVIGCLIEKQHTTPEQYPLSLNALTNACNQKSSRDPVLELDEATVQATLDALAKKHLVMDRSGFGGRVTKYQHRFGNTEFGAMKLSARELGIVCVLLLRGPQTAGELRTRTERLCKFQDIHEVESTLDHLAQREDGPFVMKLPREPGKREARFAHLFCGDIDVREAAAAHAKEAGATGAAGTGAEVDRLTELECRVARLVDEVAELRARLERTEADRR
jgi:uncharacterized protein YceH (UPF0502 family)